MGLSITPLFSFSFSIDGKYIFSSKNMSLFPFLHFQSLKKIDYEVKRKSFFETILNAEFEDTSKNGIFYQGNHTGSFYFTQIVNVQSVSASSNVKFYMFKKKVTVDLTQSDIIEGYVL